jgi:hypothetical protein
MANYRLYCADGRGKIWVDDRIAAENDAEAIAIAEGMDNLAQCELWDGDRLVATIKPDRTPGLD